MRSFILLLILFCCIMSASGQNVGVGTTTPAAKLDISSTNSGILIPRIALTGTNDAVTVPSPVTSMMIYNIATITGGNAVTPGFYYWNGTVWIRIADGGSVPNIYNSNGTLTGSRTLTMGADSLTFSGTGHVFMTSDAYIDSVRIGKGGGGIATNTVVGNGALSATNTYFGNTAVGYQALTSSSAGFANTGVGYQALYSATSGGTNTAMGSNALFSTTTGGDNTALGTNAMYANTTGHGNTSMGVTSLNNDTAGDYNTASGWAALGSMMNGSYNTAYGVFAGSSNLIGSDNTYLGNQANPSGGALSNVTAIGANALVGQSNSMVLGSINGVNGATANTSVGIGTITPAHRLEVIGEIKADTLMMTAGATAGYILQSDATGNGSWVSPSAAGGNIYTINGTLAGNRTVTMGADSLIFNSTTGKVFMTQDVYIDSVRVGKGAGSFISNTVVGNGALQNAGNTGVFNTAVGYGVLGANTTGVGNTGIGDGTLHANTIGYYNIGIGEDALPVNTTGYQNVAIGNFSLSLNTSGINNTAVGNQALYQSTTGAENTAVGALALSNNTTASFNVAIGNSTLGSNTTGSGNTAAGYATMVENTTGANNTAFGGLAIASNKTANNNTAIGQAALENDTSGSSNTAGGYLALWHTNSSDNTAFGDSAGYNNISGTSNTFLGTRSNVSSGSLTNATAIGANAYVGQSNAMVLGSINGVNGALASTLVGIGTSTPSGTLHVSSASYPNAIIDGSNSFGTWLDIANENTGGNIFSLISTSSSNPEGAGKLVLDKSSSYGISAGNIMTWVYATGNVGINNSNPLFNLDVTGQIRSTQAGGGVYAAMIAAGGSGAAYSWEASSAGTDLKWWDALAGSNGVILYRAVNDANSAATTWMQATRGTGTAVPYVGFPSSSVGIGTLTPAHSLEVIGEVKADTLMMTSGAVAGYLLQSDATGKASWVSPSTLTGTNIYNSDGTLTGNRTVTMGADNLLFNATAGNVQTTTDMYVNGLTIGRGNSGVRANTAIGINALGDNLGGIYNSAIGFNTLLNNTSGQANTATGYEALYKDTSGSNNTAYGMYAGYGNTNGSANTFLGSNSNTSSGTLTNATAIGANSMVSQSNSIVLGSVNGTNSATSGVNVGIGTTSPSSTLQVVGTTSTTNLQVTSGATAGYILQSDASGNASWVPSVSATNIYNSNGTLTGSRTVTMGADTLIFSSGTGYVATTQDAYIDSVRVGKGRGSVISNTAMGNGALGSNTFGSINTAVGYQALAANTGGGQNTAVGSNALLVNAGGSTNTALGAGTLEANTSGSGNTAVGGFSLYSNTTGGDNTAIGEAALDNNTSGFYNTAVGQEAMLSNTTGYQNAAFGGDALLLCKTGIGNTALGESALLNDSIGNYNTGSGFRALFFTKTGFYNAGIGDSAGYSNTSGSFNTFLGTKSNASSGSLINATAIGANAYVGQNNALVLGSINGVNGATASTNVGIGTTTPSSTLQVVGTTSTTHLQMTSGAAAGYFLQSDASGNASWVASTPSSANIYNSDGTLSGNRTVTMGGDNLTFSSTTGQVITTADASINSVTVGLGTNSFADNLVVGAGALAGNTTGQYDVAVGQFALTANTGGTANAALGYGALYANTFGSYNTAVGEQAMDVNTTGQDNTAVGESSLESNTTGSDNIAIGVYAGLGNSTGSGNTFLGNSSGASSGALANATAIGVNAYVSQSNSLILGEINGVNNATNSTKVGIGTTAPAYPLDVTGQIRGNQAGGGNSSAIIAAGGSGAAYAWDVTSGGTDQKWWDALAGSTAMSFRAVNDANSGATTWMQVNRGTGATVSSVAFPNSYVAIGTGSATVPLDITTGASVSSSTITVNDAQGYNAGYEYIGVNGSANSGYSGSASTFNTSIRAQYAVLTSEVVTTSDARIKNIKGQSDGTDDLSTLDKIKITDYTMRDKLHYGDRAFKKVIAQELTAVYPQAVESSHLPSVVPDIYAKPLQYTVKGGTLIATMLQSPDTNVKVGSHIRYYATDQSGAERQLMGTVSAISGTMLDITMDSAAMGMQIASVFIYGVEINDLLTVDYDAISMLNVSATQQLARQLKAAQAEIAALKTEKEKSKQQNDHLQSDVDKLKASVETLQQILAAKAER